MAEEFQLGSGNWWDNNSTSISRNRFDSGSSSTPTTSTSATTTTTTVNNNVSSNYGSSNWPTESHVDIKPRTFLDSVSVSDSSSGGGVVLSSHDPDFQSMGLGLTSQAREWNHQSLLRGEKAETGFSSILQQEDIRGFSLDQNNPIFSHSSSNYGLSQEAVDWSKFPQFLRTSPASEQPLLPPSPPPLPPPPHSQLHFSNNTPFWNASADSMNPQLPNNTTVDEKAKIAFSKKTSSTETTNKRPRNDQTPSPSPAFKVKKEKMGDRITALQQLVSPFGKTDTASVLSEAIEYIKFLHDQIGALSAPYMKSGAPMQHQQSGIKSEDVAEGRNKDLRNRGLCLVPISSTFPVTHETTVDFWTPTFGATFR